MRIALVSLAAIGLAACNSSTPPTTVSEPRPVSGPQAVATPPTAPIETRSPNKADAKPAFAGQTRAPAMNSGIQLAVETVATGLSEPWGIAVMPDGSVLVTERTGKLKHITRAGAVKEISGAPETDTRGQGGLLDISLAPDFASSRSIYMCYAEPRGERRNGTSLARAKLSADGAKLEGLEVIFRQTPDWASVLHFGCNIEWAADGNLFLTLGERSNPEPRKQAQDLNSLLGKVVRLKPDGKPADGNPFLGRSDARPEIWAYGLRNVQGAAIQPGTGQLWTIEHGPRGGDELNVPKAGKNYGWPVISYGIEYAGPPIGEGITAREGMEQPVYYWDPVIAPGDMTFYTGNLFPWKGDLLIAGLSGELVRLKLDGERVVGEEHMLKDLGRLRDVAQAADGALWVVTDENSGVLARVTPKR
jgi:aldose sugar dehydrogenase